MTNFQRRLLLFIFGVFLLSLTLFREEIFTGSIFGIWVYRFMAMGSTLLTVGAFGRLFGRRWMWAALCGLLLAEVAIALLFQVSAGGGGIAPKSGRCTGLYLPQPLPRLCDIRP